MRLRTCEDDRRKRHLKISQNVDCKNSRRAVIISRILVVCVAAFCSSIFCVFVSSDSQFCYVCASSVSHVCSVRLRFSRLLSMRLRNLLCSPPLLLSSTLCAHPPFITSALCPPPPFLMFAQCAQPHLTSALCPFAASLVYSLRIGRNSHLLCLHIRRISRLSAPPPLLSSALCAPPPILSSALCAPPPILSSALCAPPPKSALCCRLALITLSVDYNMSSIVSFDMALLMLPLVLKLLLYVSVAPAFAFADVSFCRSSSSD